MLKALFEILPREDCNTCLWGASHGPLSLALTPPPYHKSDETMTPRNFLNCRHVLFLAPLRLLSFMQPAAWNRASSHHPGHWEDLLFSCVPSHPA